MAVAYPTIPIPDLDDVSTVLTDDFLVVNQSDGTRKAKINDVLNVWSRLHYRGETSAYLSRTSMSEPNPGYEFLDVGFNYKFTPHLKGKFGVYNILDEVAENADKVVESVQHDIETEANTVDFEPDTTVEKVSGEVVDEEDLPDFMKQEK